TIERMGGDSPHSLPEQYQTSLGDARQPGDIPSLWQAFGQRSPGRPTGLLTSFAHALAGALEPRQGPLPRDLRARLVIAATLVAMEAVAGILVHMNVAVGALLLDGLHVAHRDALILVAEMELRRDPRLLVREGDDAAAVIADRGAQAIEAAGGQERDGAAHAEAHDAHRSDVLERRDGSGGVAPHGVPVRICDELARLLDLLRGGGRPEVAHLAIEQRRRHGHVAFGREAVAHAANVMIDPEDFLDDHHSADRLAARLGAIGTKAVVVGCSELDRLTQADLPLLSRATQDGGPGCLP